MTGPFDHAPLWPFTSDGCSGGFSWGYRHLAAPAQRRLARLFGWRPWPAALPFRHVCRDHDFAYWQGGSWQDRLVADLTMARQVALEDGQGNGAARWWAFVAVWMLLAVRLGGGPWWPLSWRWGYGRPRWNGYRAADRVFADEAIYRAWRRQRELSL